MITSTAFYPRENTFALQNQNYKNTTRVVFKVQYQWTDDEGNELTVYCKEGNPSIIYKRDDAAMFLKEAVVTSGAIEGFINKYVDGALAVKAGIGTDNGDGTYTIHYGVNDFSWNDISTVTDKTYLTINSLSFANSSKIKDCLKLPEDEAKDESGNVLTAEQQATKLNTAMTTALNEAMATANNSVKIVSFYGGTKGNNICYYAVNIQHFGDTYCPMPEGFTGIDTETVYGTPNKDSKAKFLGRWGMVRNNWYELAIGTIANMGSVNVPEAEGITTSDDNNQEQYYLSARIHILSWAKRTQNHNF